MITKVTINKTIKIINNTTYIVNLEGNYILRGHCYVY